MNPFDWLRNSLALAAGDRLVPGISSYREGAVATLVPTEKLGWDFIQQNGEGIEGLGQGPPKLVEVGDPWEFMRRAAGEGLAGFVSASPEQPEIFKFMVRIEEAGSKYPTVLAKGGPNSNHDCLTRTAFKTMSDAELLCWSRYDILDQVNAKWGKKCPFRGWKQGDPLYELRTDSMLILLSDVPLLGDWNSTDGAFAFFTNLEEANYYKNHLLEIGQNRIIGLEDSYISTESSPRIDSVQPVRIDDISARLNELEEIWQLATWCINPHSHRESSGFGRIWERNKDSGFQLRTAAGNWLIKKGNYFDRTQDPLAWSGEDTLFWSGSQSIPLTPLDSSFRTDNLSAVESISEMSDLEAEEWIEQYLFGPKVPDDEYTNPTLESFVISCWDSVTGERPQPTPRLNSFLDALRYLSDYENHHDSDSRFSGAETCNAIGFRGSQDEGNEALRGERFFRGLINLGKRFLKEGYHPSFAENLVSMANATLRTLHVDFAGYTKDLLWSVDSENRSKLLEDLEIEPNEWERWVSGADAVVDPIGKKLVIKRTGEQVWEKLEAFTQHFLSTALVHLRKQGHAPQLDYAPISMEITKGLEVELVKILESFREFIGDQVHESFEKDRVLYEYLYEGAKAPSLGAISYLLRKLDCESSPLLRSFHSYLSDLGNFEFLTSNKFSKRALQKVLNRYRNGGVHSSPIPEEICLSCVETLVGSIEKPGLIAKTVEWKK